MAKTISRKQQIKLLEKLMEYAFSAKQYEIMESFRDTLQKRDLSERQQEIANEFYVQLRGITIKNESIKLLNNLKKSNNEFIAAYLDTYIEQSSMPEKDTKLIIKSVIHYCEDRSLRQRISNLYTLKFL